MTGLTMKLPPSITIIIIINTSTHDFPQNPLFILPSNFVLKVDFF